MRAVGHFAVAVFCTLIGAVCAGQESSSSTPMDVATAKIEAARAVEATRLARTYSSIVDAKQTGDQPWDIEWRVEFAAPDRFHVRQASAGQYDEWITIGKENYRSIGVGWMKRSAEEPDVNRLLGVEKFLHLLATTEPISARESVTPQERSIILHYRVALGPDFTFLSKAATGPSEVRVWINEGSHQVVKGEVVMLASANGKNSKLALQQSFTGYGAAIRIEAPPIQTALAQKLPDLGRPEDLAQFIGTYYQHPRPELIGRAMELLPSSPDMNVPSAAGPTMAFFSEVFSANPDRLSEWQSTIDKQDARTKSFLSRAVVWSKEGGVLKVDGHSSGINDLYWGAFFATGKPVFIERLVDEMKYADERDNFELWGAGATAKWSLASNARQHPLVRTILESGKSTADKQTQDMITEVLIKDPADLQREIRETVARQRAAGKWK
jgi:hypothetical protein